MANSDDLFNVPELSKPKNQTLLCFNWFHKLPLINYLIRTMIYRGFLPLNI